MKNTLHENIPIDPEHNQRLAYKLWEQAGRPSDRSLDFWLEAEHQLRAIPRKASVADAKQVAKQKPLPTRASPTTAKRTMALR